MRSLPRSACVRACVCMHRMQAANESEESEDTMLLNTNECCTTNTVEFNDFEFKIIAVCVPFTIQYYRLIRVCCFHKEQQSQQQRCTHSRILPFDERPAFRKGNQEGIPTPAHIVQDFVTPHYSPTMRNRTVPRNTPYIRPSIHPSIHGTQKLQRYEYACMQE
mmetsp:Transcript_11499/g.23345  ORF Transcript_11499/g.23345 Transcript_11499/m.23345 type:complete len:163 (+) Transcript_11499:570-1058(+)